MQQSTNISSTFSKYCTGYCGFGFNGKENDNEVKGAGNSLDFGARIYDPRIGRWLSVDPLAKDFPGISPYNFSYNNPLLFKDPNGKAGVITVTKNSNGGGNITIESTIFLYGVKANETAAQLNNKWTNEVSSKGNNSYTYYDENNKPWIVTVNLTYVYTQVLDEQKTINNNQKDISLGNVNVTGVNPTTGVNYTYQFPGLGGSMIGAKVSNSSELARVSEDGRSALGFGDPSGGLGAITPDAFIQETFHGLGLRDHLEGSANSNDVLYKWGGGTSINPIHFIDIAENILKQYNNSEIKDSEPTPYNSSYNQTSESNIDSKLSEQETRKQNSKD